MEGALKELLNYGALGIVLAAVLGVTLWQHKVLFGNVIEQQKAFSDYMKELTRTLVGIRENCQVCRADSLACLRDVEGRLATKFQEVVWAAHDKTFAEIEKGLTEAAAHFEQALTGAAQSIREALADERERRLREEVEELSRPHNISGAVVR
jgi:hypothetical protein